MINRPKTPLSPPDVHFYKKQNTFSYTTGQKKKVKQTHEEKRTIQKMKPKRFKGQRCVAESFTRFRGGSGGRMGLLEQTQRAPTWDVMHTKSIHKPKRRQKKKKENNGPLQQK